MDTSRAAPAADQTSAGSAVAVRRVPEGRVLLALTLALATVLTGCVTRTSDGGEVIVSPEDRAFEVRSARVALTEPVPALVAEIARVVEAAERVWTAPGDSTQRARLAVAFDLEPLRAAALGIAEVEVVGAGPDVLAVRDVLARMVERAEDLGAQVELEMAELAAVAETDVVLSGLVEAWDEPGSYSRQVTLFQETADAAAALATELSTRTAVVPCTELWGRRSQAATLLEQRTLELRDLIRNRDGELFDETRSTYREDPYGLAMRPGEADAAAADACWSDASDVAAAEPEMAALVAELSGALDPAELRS